MKKLSLIVLFALMVNSVYPQTFRNGDADKIVKGSDLVTLDENTKTIKHICFAESESRKYSIKDNGLFLREVLSLPSDYNLRLFQSYSDSYGATEKYQIEYNGIAIKDFIYNIHNSGNKLSANGYYTLLSPEGSTPSMSESEAFNYALVYVGAKEYQWEVDPTFTKPKGLLFYIENDNKLVLVYRFDIFSSQPMSRQYVYVNALNGNIELTEERIHIYTNATGTAVTKYQGTKTITTDYNGGTYRLRENLRGNGIETYDLNNGTSYGSAVDFTDTDNSWNTTTNQDDAAYDAHFGTEATYDFFYTNFGRNSIDGSGFALKSYVHYSSGYVNAFWNGSYMTYGDGDGLNYTALTCIDIVGHEITHGLTEYSANLNYSYESGALNESFSDIFGTAIDFYANPTIANYLMGDQISSTGTPFRSMINPNLYSQPDTYHGSYWYTGSGDYGGVHYNSGVQNYWFYLLCVGGSGINDIGNSYTVTPIGMDKASKIAYRTLTSYLTPTSQYADARYYSIQAAIDLYGECSTEVINVTNAWYAVGVGAVYSNAVIANYTASQNYFCTYPASVQFTNRSVNASTYLWDFGDGTNSTLANPTHVYDTTGNYTVTLISTGTSACNSTDTLVSPTPIIVTDTGGPISASCTPGTNNSSGLYGIINFSFNGVTNSTLGSADGYKDYTCQFSSTVTEGLTYTYSITVGTSILSMVKLWIDLDNDGQFNSSTELIVNDANVTSTKMGTINIPHPAIYNVPLRLRIASDNSSSSNLQTSCTNSTNGQYEDYSVIILQNTQPPAVDFTASLTTINVGQTVSFADLSLNLPTSWAWSFPGGSPSTSTVKNPTVSYGSTGLFPVMLKATNKFGQDSLLKKGYINVVTTYNMCSTNSTTLSNGILCDSGGPSGPYKNGENCSFLIDPGCATSITLTFNSFILESCCDYLTVYDGADANGTLLLRVNGANLPNPVTAKTGKMYITFTSDGSATYSGFQATWTSVVPPSNPPVTDFDISNENPPLNSAVEFTDQSTNLPTRWIWNFGDGEISIEQHPQHTYSSPGLKTVSLVSFNCYGSDTSIQTIDVQLAPLFSIAPNILNERISGCNDSVNGTIVIKNSGLGDLEWNYSGFSYTIGDDFDPGLDDSFWKTLTGGVAAATCGFFTPPNALYFNGSVREAITKPINTIKGGIVEFYLEISNGTSPCEKADAGENIDLSYSINNGITWVKIQSYNPENYNTFTNVRETIPEGAKSGSTLFKWSQPSFSGTGCDNWSIDNVSISFTSKEFYHLSVASGLIAPGDSSAIDISFSSNELKTDVYTDTLVIYSNDPLSPLQKIACTLTVEGTPEMAFSDTSILFSDLFVGLSLTDTLKVINTGCDALLIDNITTSSSDFEVDKTILDIAPSDTALVRVTFSPSTAGAIDGFLTIHSNDTDTLIHLEGYGIDPPVMDISPERLSVITNSCNDSITKRIVVSNQGISDLTIQLEGNTERTIEMVALTYGVDYANEYTNTLAAIKQYFTNYRLTEINTTSALALETALRDKDVLLIAEQESGSSSVFTGFAQVIQSFVNNGGEVIFCGTNNPSCIFNTGLFSGYFLGDAASSTINVVNTNHPVTDSLPDSFTAPNATYLLNIINMDTTRLLRCSDYYDVVTARKIGKGKAIYIGFDYYTYNSQTARIIANAVKWSIARRELPDWLSFSGIADTISSGDSTVIDITFNPEGLNNGVYSDSISIYSNDPLRPQQKVACTLTVDGTPEVALSDTSILFSDLFVGLSLTDTLKVINTGCDALLIDNITTSNSDFEVDKTVIAIAPGDTALVRVTFSPSTAGAIDGFLTIHSNDNDTLIHLEGYGIDPPVMDISPERLSVITNSCDDSITKRIVVSNQGISDLTIQLEGNTEQTIEMVALTYGVDYANEYTNTLAAIKQYFTNYRLTEINTTSALALETALRDKDVLLIANQESGSSSVFTGFAQVIQSFVNNGGEVIFCGTYNPSCIFNTGIFSGYYQGNASSSTINVVNTNHPVIDSVSVSFTAPYNTHLISISNTDATRLLQYSNYYEAVIAREIGKGKAIYIGFDYYAYNSHTARIIANAVKWSIAGREIPDWLSFSGIADTISSGDSTVIDITFKPEGLNNGVYSDSITLYSNDPLFPQQKIACTLTVDGKPAISYSDTCVVFGDVFNGATATDTILIINSGCDELLINKITSSHSDFTVKKNAMNIAPGDSAMVPITFTPSSIGDINGFLTLYSNTNDTILCLKGTGIEPPILNIDATALQARINACNDSITRQLVVSNSGESPLTIRIEGVREKTVEMLSLTYGVDYANEYTNTLAAINQYFTNYRLTEINTTSASVLETALQGKDVLLIAKQESGSSSVFTGFAQVIQSFVKHGGRVIFCGTYNYNCIFNTGIFSGYYAGDGYSSTVNVVNTNHPVTDGVSGLFIMPFTTFLLNISNTDTTRLLRYANYYDVVTARELGKGKAIFIGFDYNTYSNDAARIIANAVKWGNPKNAFSEWLAINNPSDTLSVNETSYIDVRLKPMHLNNGLYVDTISIHSNDPLKPLTKIRCSMTIDGTPELALSDTIVVFSNVYSGYNSKRNITISNSGCDTLLISSIISSQPYFKVRSSSINIAPGDSEMIEITFSPDSPGTYSGYLSIYSNDVDTVLNLRGTCFESPELALSADTIHLMQANGSYNYISLSSSKSWTVSSNQSWLTVSPQSGSGNHLLIFTATGNATLTSRTAIVTVRLASGQSETVTVIQGGFNSNQVINRTTQTIEIDGFPDDAWDIADKVPISLPFRTEHPTVTATWSSLYDDNGLYVMVEVNDNDHWPGWESGGDSWLYDTPEVYWDVNEVLDDGRGAGYNAGHYMLADGFMDGMYDTPITKSPSGNHPGGTYSYSLIGEGYNYEHFVPFSNLRDGNGVAITSSTTRPLGFDVTVVDQDEGITTSRQRCVWSNDGNGNNGSTDESWNNMDGAGTITLGEYLPQTPLNKILSNVSFGNGRNECSDAVSTITLAGGGSSVSFLSGSSVELIAGSSIRFLPGFHAYQGNYTRAWITTDGMFCDGASGAIVENPQPEKSGDVISESNIGQGIDKVKSIKVYPNPNNGKFTIALTNIGLGSGIAIYNALGVLVYQSLVLDATIPDIDLSGTRRGLYVVVVTDGKERVTRKVLVE